MANDFWNFVGDPAGYVSGYNKEGLGGIKKMLGGDPASAKAAYDDAIAKSMQMGQQTKDFLMGQQGKALEYYAPINHMFQNLYGAQGLQPQMQVGAVPGSQPQGNINQMLMGKR